MKMLKYTNFFIVFFATYIQTFASTYIPLIIDYNSIFSKDSTIIALGNYGTIMYSENLGKDWEKIIIFGNDKIIKIVDFDNKFIAITNKCKIAVSDDSGKNWTKVADLEKEIACAVFYNGSFFVRNLNFIFRINNNYEISNITDSLQINPLHLQFPRELQLEYLNKSLLYFNNYLISVMDSNNKYLRFDENLNLIDTLDISQNGICNNCEIMKSEIFNTKKYFYFNVSQNQLCRTNDFKSFELVSNRNNTVGITKEVNEKLYYSSYSFIDLSLNYHEISEFVTPDSLQRRALYIPKGLISRLPLMKINDFDFVDNKIIIVGNSNFIAIIDISSLGIDNNKINYVSQLSEINNKQLGNPILLANNTLLFAKNMFVTGSADYGKTFEPRTDYSQASANNYRFYANQYISPKLMSFNNKIKRLYYGIELPYRMYYSDDYGQTFSYKDLNDIIMTNELSEMEIINNTILVSENYWYNDKYYNLTFFYDKDLNLIDQYQDSNFIVKNVYSENQNSIKYFCLNSNANKQEYYIKVSNNRGNDWSYIKMYNDSLIYLKHEVLYFNNTKYWVVVNYDITNMKLNIDMFDLSNDLYFTLYSRNILYEEIDLNSIVINSDEEQIYFTINNIFYRKKHNEDNFNLYELKNNGKIQKYMIFINNDLYAFYKSDIQDANTYLLKDFKTFTSSINIENDFIYEALIIYPSYPLPSNNLISTKLFWTGNFHNPKFELFNIFGIQLTDFNYSFEKIDNNNGILKWNCTGVPSGTYLIKIQHGNNTKSVKVVVN